MINVLTAFNSSMIGIVRLILGTLLNREQLLLKIPIFLPKLYQLHLSLIQTSQSLLMLPIPLFKMLFQSEYFLFLLYRLLDFIRINILSLFVQLTSQNVPLTSQSFDGLGLTSALVQVVFVVLGVEGVAQLVQLQHSAVLELAVTVQLLLQGLVVSLQVCYSLLQLEGFLVLLLSLL